MESTKRGLKGKKRDTYNSHNITTTQLNNSGSYKIVHQSKCNIRNGFRKKIDLTLSCHNDSVQITPYDVEQLNPTKQSFGHNYLRSVDESYFTILQYPGANLLYHIITGISAILQTFFTVVFSLFLDWFLHCGYLHSTCPNPFHQFYLVLS